MSSSRINVKNLPRYLQDVLSEITAEAKVGDNHYVEVLSLSDIQSISSKKLQHAHLLLLRHDVTTRIANSGVLYPPFLLDRSRIYEALNYADLATADAFIVYTLCETILGEEWVSDLEPQELSGDAWLQSEPDAVLPYQIEALAILVRCLNKLGATVDADEKYEELTTKYCNLHPQLDVEENKVRISNLLKGPFLLRNGNVAIQRASGSRFGMSRREIYPWNEHEPDRNSSRAVQEINTILSKVAPDLEARVTILPALNNSSEFWHQLGLFARKDLTPSSTILREKSILTAIRPLEDALCDACGADLESIPRENMRQCPGEACDVTFCSDECATRAPSEYHKPNDETDDNGEEDDYPPASAPFCGNMALNEIGRTASTDAAEWDLYFLLLTRTIQMSITQDCHILNLSEIKYLWGDFETEPDAAATLPFSLYHNISLPLQFFETLMHSVPSTKPYTADWLRSFDWWIVQTLYAKFRGVANAQQSTYDGKPEIAAVHPMWCLANHNCAPNVSWTPTGLREFKVLEEKDRIVFAGAESNCTGVKANKEIWSHYTDVRLPVQQRRERLREVLGGECQCERCLREAGQDI